MFLWFIGTAVVSVWFVFTTQASTTSCPSQRTATRHHRPPVRPGPLGASLTVLVGVLVVVMPVTTGREPIRRVLSQCRSA